MSRANLQPKAMCRTSISVRPSRKVDVMPTSANKGKKLLSVLCSSIVRRSDVTAGPHGTVAAGLKLKKAVCVPDGTVLVPTSTVHTKQTLSVTVVVTSHVTAAVSCCLEMALWRTLWMVDQVSLTAIGGLSASRTKKLMNFLACGPGRPVWSHE